MVSAQGGETARIMRFEPLSRFGLSEYEHHSRMTHQQ